MQFEFESTKAVSLKYSIKQGELSDAHFGPESPLITYKYRDTTHKFCIYATDQGVYLRGTTPTFTSQEELDELNKVIQWAFRHHQSLKVTGLPLDQEVLNQELLS